MNSYIAQEMLHSKKKVFSFSSLVSNWIMDLETSDDGDLAVSASHEAKRCQVNELGVITDFCHIINLLSYSLFLSLRSSDNLFMRHFALNVATRPSPQKSKFECFSY